MGEAISGDEAAVINPQAHAVAGKHERLMGLPGCPTGSSPFGGGVQPMAAALGPGKIVITWGIGILEGKISCY